MSRTDKRSEIVSAAKALIAEQGFHGAPMALIAERAGVGAGTIYRYFENRDVLIMEIHREIYESFTSFLMGSYRSDRPIRERYFHIGSVMIAYYVNNPLDFRYSEQFHNSPYGVEYRRKKLFDNKGDYDFYRDLYEAGREQQIIKDVPMATFFNLAFGPIFWALRDHATGFVTLTDELSKIIVSACWDSIKL
jgi:AcrR family transcriptional regulator